jgi:hypothetical protein
VLFFRIFVKYRVRQQFLCTATTNFPAVYLQHNLQGKMQGNKIDKEIARKSSFKQGN